MAASRLAYAHSAHARIAYGNSIMAAASTAWQQHGSMARQRNGISSGKSK